MQEKLVSIMSRLRTHTYVIMVDIKKMYRQIWLTENQRYFQRILGYKNPDQLINKYYLKTATYDVIISSYLQLHV